MKKFEEPKFNIIKIQSQDVITTSGDHDNIKVSALGLTDSSYAEDMSSFGL